MSKFKVEVGKIYRAYNGEKIGPMRAYVSTSIDCEFDIDHDDNINSHSDRSELWSATGKPVTNQDLTLIEEWIDKPSPIRTVTRKEIVSGTYGKVKVSFYPDGSPFVYVGFPKGSVELREAAHVLNQIAEVLEEIEK